MEHYFKVKKKDLKKLSEALPEVQDAVGRTLIHIMNLHKQGCGNLAVEQEIDKLFSKNLKGYKY